MTDERAHVPDYVAACDLLAFVSRYAVILFVAFALSDSVRAGSPSFFIVLFAAIWTSDVLWGLAARAMERRTGAPGRRVRTVLGQTAVFWGVTAVVAFLAMSITGSALATIAIVIGAQIAVSAVLQRRREASEGA